MPESKATNKSNDLLINKFLLGDELKFLFAIYYSCPNRFYFYVDQQVSGFSGRVRFSRCIPKTGSGENPGGNVLG